MIDLENRLRLLETTINFKQNHECLSCKEKAENFYEK